MKINIINLKSETKKLSKLINEYEEIFLNLYNEILSGSIYWDDNISKLFFENINIEKNQVENTINELNDLKEIYEELIRKYEEIGNKIEVLPKTKDEILSAVNNYLDKLHKLIELYYDLNLEFNNPETSILHKHLDKLIKIKSDVFVLKEKIKKHYETIEELERKINLKISKIKIELIKEKEKNKFI